MEVEVLNRCATHTLVEFRSLHSRMLFCGFVMSVIMSGLEVTLVVLLVHHDVRKIVKVVDVIMVGCLKNCRYRYL